MDEKLDLRIQKTYIALTRTFFEMLKEMRFEDIKVSDLCERAMIRKSTFYKHFGDKYELLAFVVRREQEKFNAQLSQERKSADKIDYYIQLIEVVLDALAANSALVESAIQSNSFPLVLSILSDQIMLDIRERIREDAQSGEELPASPDVMTAFFVGGVMEAVRSWLKKGKPIDAPELKAQLSRILRQFYSAVRTKHKLRAPS